MSYVFLVGLSGDAARGMRAWAAFVEPGRDVTQTSMSKSRKNRYRLVLLLKFRRGASEFATRPRVGVPVRQRRKRTYFINNAASPRLGRARREPAAAVRRDRAHPAPDPSSGSPYKPGG